MELRFGLDVATDGEWSDVRLLADLAAEAEAAGWDGFFVWDILLAENNKASPLADPWIALTAIALRTQRMRIGAMVTPLPRRRAWDVARQVATLDRLSGGRMVLGAGLGWQQDDFVRFGEEFDLRVRAEKLDESLAAIVALWSGQPAELAGTHVRLDGPVMLPTPVQRPRVPIWLAAGWPRRRPLARAARWDGAYLMTLHQETQQPLAPDDVAQAADILRSQREDGSVGELAVSYYLDEPESATARATAGATWCLGLTPDTVDEHRALIRQGPPSR